jgi:hypothetical protein
LETSDLTRFKHLDAESARKDRVIARLTMEIDGLAVIVQRASRLLNDPRAIAVVDDVTRECLALEVGLLIRKSRRHPLLRGSRLYAGAAKRRSEFGDRR